jgi:hypothetical protein
MKLYATTTSERASKGQGGQWLDINIKDERNVTFAIIQARKIDGKAMPVLYIESIGEVIGGKEKGNNQKGENCICIDGELNRKCTAELHNF